MLAEVSEEIVNLPGLNNLFTKRNLGFIESVDRVICEKSCQGCAFYSDNPGCTIPQIIEEVKTTHSIFEQFYE